MPTIAVPLRDPDYTPPLILLSGEGGTYEGIFEYGNLGYIMDSLQRFPQQSLGNINSLRNALRRSLAAHNRNLNMERQEIPRSWHGSHRSSAARQVNLHRRALRHPIFFYD